MRRSLFFLLPLLGALAAPAQRPEYPATAYTAEAYATAWRSWAGLFAQARAERPGLPPGLPEALAWSRTHWRALRPSAEGPSCLGLPGYHGPFGLVSEGRGWFHEQASAHARAAGVPVAAVLEDPAVQARAVLARLAALGPVGNPDPLAWADALRAWSELPSGQGFAADAALFEVYRTLADPAFRDALGLEGPGPDVAGFFGPERFGRLTAPRVDGQDTEGDAPSGEALPPCNDYAPAGWTAADPSNWSSRAGTAISAVTVHTMQGYYAGTLSWFQNPAANVSAHYVMRASDGQVTQMVCEADKAWHVGSENPYTVGIEHEGFIADPSWYTPVTYTESAELTRDVALDHGILRLRTYAREGTSGLLTLGGCTRIKGHQHFPFQSHVDPGPHWNWAHYYKLVNEPAPVTTLTASTGTLSDPGGSGAYGDDQRRVWVIDPPGSGAVTLSFSAFSLEADWDYLYLYDGDDVYAPLIGAWTGTAGPGTVTSGGGALTVEFRSDCATVAPGFSASWTTAGGGGGCATPTGTFTGPIGWTSATINWNPVPAAAQYQVRGRKAGTTAWRQLVTPLTAKWLGIFREGTAYEWQVRADCGSGAYSGWSVLNGFATNSLRRAAEAWSVGPVPATDAVWVRGLPPDARLRWIDATGRVLLEAVVPPDGRLPVPPGAGGIGLLQATAADGTPLGHHRLNVLRP
jgi:hypothetical protein